MSLSESLMKSEPDTIIEEKLHNENALRDQLMLQRQQTLEETSKQQLFILQEMLGKIDGLKNNLEGLDSRINNLENKGYSKVSSKTDRSVSSKASMRPPNSRKQAVIENLHKGRPCYQNQIDAISDLTSMIENSEFSFENLRLKNVNNLSNQKGKTSAPKIISTTKKIQKQRDSKKELPSNPTSGKQSAKFEIKRNLVKQLKEKNLASDGMSVSNGSTKLPDYFSVANY